MLILGKNNEDKGAQLEILTWRILESLGYQNVVRGEIKAGGAEIDVAAEWVTPTLNGTDTKPIICECKAHRAPQDMTDWLKFLGKVHSEEVERGQEVKGFFISLSGVNGNVTGNYNTYRQKRPKAIELMNESDVLAAARKHSPLCSVEEATSAIRSFTERPIRSFEAAYYDAKLYWLVFFEDEFYAILDGAGENLPQDKEAAIAPLVEKITAGAKLLNLLEERGAMQTTLMLEKELLASFADRGGGWPVSSTDATPDTTTGGPPEPPPSSTAHLLPGFDRIIKRLEDRGWVSYSQEQQRLGLRVDETGRCPDFVSIVEFMLTSIVPAKPLLTLIQSDFYVRHIDSELVAEIRKIQGGLPLTTEQVHKLIALLRLTPTGLLRLLRPIDLIVNHRIGQQAGLRHDGVDQADVMMLFQAVYDALFYDFKHPVLKPFFFACGIRELEHQHQLILKSETRIEHEGSVSTRLVIAPVTEELGGGLTHLLALPDSLQPWESVPQDKQNSGDTSKDNGQLNTGLRASDMSE